MGDFPCYGMRFQTIGSRSTSYAAQIASMFSLKFI
jgi:hypothetical protein